MCDGGAFVESHTLITFGYCAAIDRLTMMIVDWKYKVYLYILVFSIIFPSAYKSITALPFCADKEPQSTYVIPLVPYNAITFPSTPYLIEPLT